MRKNRINIKLLLTSIVILLIIIIMQYSNSRNFEIQQDEMSGLVDERDSEINELKKRNKNLEDLILEKSRESKIVVVEAEKKKLRREIVAIDSQFVSRDSILVKTKKDSVFVKEKKDSIVKKKVVETDSIGKI